MRCPRCAFEGGSLENENTCQRCGATLRRDVAGSTSQPAQYLPSLDTNISYSHQLQPGSTLHQGRYLLIEQVKLAVNQQDQRPAWLATDTTLPNQPVIIRPIIPPGEITRSPSTYEYTCKVIAQQLAELGKHYGLPQVIELFYEQVAYFLVSLLPQGRTLSYLVQQQGGPLLEHIVADYGQQLCDILIKFGEQKPPFVHGAINPETIIISEDGTHASLAYLPLFPPKEVKNPIDKTSSSYNSPEQNHGTLTPSSDLYSIAAVMYFALTGHKPQERTAFFYPPLRQLNPLATAHIETILAHQLRMSVPQRYATPSEMQQDLIGLIDSYPEIEDNISSHDPTLIVIDDPHLMTSQQRREWNRSTDLLNIGVYAAVCTLLIIGLLFTILRP
jgi:serine/threonine protein kinase